MKRTATIVAVLATAFVLGVISTAVASDTGSESENGVLYTKWVQAPLGQLMDYSDLRSAAEEIKSKVEEFKGQGLHVGVIKTSYASRGETGSEAKGGESHHGDSNLSNRRQAQTENVLNEVGVNGLCPIFTSPTFGPTGKRGVELKVILLSAAQANGITQEDLDEALEKFEKALKDFEGQFMNDLEDLAKKYAQKPVHFGFGPATEFVVPGEGSAFLLTGGSWQFQAKRLMFGTDLLFGGQGKTDVMVRFPIQIEAFRVPLGESWSYSLYPSLNGIAFWANVDEAGTASASWYAGGMSLLNQFQFVASENFAMRLELGLGGFYGQINGVLFEDRDNTDEVKNDENKIPVNNRGAFELLARFVLAF